MAYPKELKTIGDHIKKRRLDVNLLQKDVAGILGVDTATIINWERNRCRPTLQVVPKIVRFLEYDPFPVTERQSIGEAIKAYRLMNGLSLKKLAMTLGVDPATLARWEKGQSKLSQELVKRLIDVVPRGD